MPELLITPIRTCRLVAAAALIGGAHLSLAQSKLTLPDRWVYCATNLSVDANVDKLEPLFKRAAQAHYTGIQLNDTKFAKLADQTAHYFENIARVKKMADATGLEIIPGVFPIGVSESILAHDPNLAEGLPVRDALFVVRNGEARPVADPDVSLPAVTDLARWGFHDSSVTVDGAALKFDGNAKRARLHKTIAVHPFRLYHLWVKVKTRDFAGQAKAAVLVKNEHALNYHEFETKPTQDWTTYHEVFNSLDNATVDLYAGFWEAKGGNVWLKDLQIEEAGPVNLIRRNGAPLEVKQEDGRTLVEGKDFEKLVDPRSGTKPWSGCFDIYHQPPVIKTSLPDGTRLRVSYYHAVTISDKGAPICLSEPKTLELLRDEAKRMHAAWGAKAYFMNHDEIRVLNWCEACQKRDLQPGQMLAENVKACTQALKEVNPGGRVYVWSDMFDPGHNAHKDYYLVHGDLAGSWEGLDKDVIIVCWDQERALESMKFFADRGHQVVMAGYYDEPVEGARQWLDSALKVPGVRGMMYTTWIGSGGYRDLEPFAKIMAGYCR